MRQKKSPGKIIRRDRFYLPTKTTTVLIRATSLETALEAFAKYHGDRATIDTKKVRRVKVKRIETAERGFGVVGKNNTIERPKKKVKIPAEVKTGLYEPTPETDFLDIKII